MKNLELSAYGVEEMKNEEMKNVEGGDVGGWGIAAWLYAEYFQATEMKTLKALNKRIPR